MKKINLFIVLSITTILTSSLEASMELKQFCFNDNVVQNKNIAESNMITISGLKKPVLAEVKGRGGYILNGVYMGKEKSMVKNGDHIRIHHEPLEADGAKVSTTLVVADVFDVFTTVTQKESNIQVKNKSISKTCQRRD